MGSLTAYHAVLHQSVMLQELGFKEAFWPLYALDEAEANTLTNIALRAGFAALAAGTFWVLVAYAPDKGRLPGLEQRAQLPTVLTDFASPSLTVTCRHTFARAYDNLLYGIPSGCTQLCLSVMGEILLTNIQCSCLYASNTCVHNDPYFETSSKPHALLNNCHELFVQDK